MVNAKTAPCSMGTGQGAACIAQEDQAQVLNLASYSVVFIGTLSPMILK